MLIDTHCHLDYADFDGEHEPLLQRAREAGVEMMINPGLDVESSRDAIHLANKFESIYAAVGVHPNDGESWNADSLDEIRELAQISKVVAIGEIGLDYYRDAVPKAMQIDILDKQLRLANEMTMPVILHNRNANEDLMQILRDWHAELVTNNSLLAERPGVLHSFSGDRKMAEEALSLNFKIGLNGPVTFRNAIELQELVETLPLEGLLLETDSPFLSPHPHRGKRNEPSRLTLVAEKVGQLLGKSFEEVAEVTSKNALELFAMEVLA